MTRVCVAVLVAACVAPLTASAHTQDAPGAGTVAARKHFFGADNVDATGKVRSDRVILSWFSVASMAMAIDGRVVLLDTYIHKGEATPNFVPTTTDELAALRPEVIFIGHGHFDHANTGGELAVRTGAAIVGTPEHCDQAQAQAEAYSGEFVALNCMHAVERASAPGAQVNSLRPLGPNVGVTVFKHLHSAAEPPDGENHETSLASGALPDPNHILSHPPGPGTAAGLASGGDEGSSLLYQFRIGRFSLTWHDTVGPLREEAPELFKLLEALPPTDVEVGSTLGFNDPTNGQSDPVDYVVRIKPKIFFPSHHDFVAEYGVSRGLEGVFRRELAKRSPVPTEVRWLYDPYDYLRPELLTFDVARDPVATPSESCLRPRQAIAPGTIGRIGVGRTASALVARAGVAPARRTESRITWCVQGQQSSVTAVLGGGRSRLVATTARSHVTRGVRPGSPARRLDVGPRDVRPGREFIRASLEAGGV